MILTYFKPDRQERPANAIGFALSQRAYSLDGRIPEPLVRLMERLDRR
jgi:hypothetical protein